MSRGRILVVDDNELNRELLEQELEDEGFTILTASDGPEALELLDDEEIDLVLLDIQMPKMSGLEVLEIARRDYPLSELPIIVVTARSGSSDVVEALGLGATDYVTKPIDFPVLLARITTHMRIRERSGTESGAYRRLTGDRAPRFVETDLYCPRCLSAVPPAASDCPECGQSAYEWPAIPRTDYPELGRIHGGYYFDKMLGAGWEGIVYRARSLDLDRAFAAKVANLGKHTKLNSRDLVVAEVQALVKLRHPHVLQIFEVVNVRAQVYALITEYLDGFTLREVADAGPMAPRDAIEIARQIALGLDEVHRHGMVHCDLKPENVIVRRLASGEYFAKVVDFGIVKSTGTVAPSGVFIGTPKYASPESFDLNVEIDARADVYSLGALLYRMLTSLPPYRRDSTTELLRSHLTEPIPRLEDSGAAHPDFAALDTIIARSMSKSRDDRYQSMTEVIEALEALGSFFVAPTTRPRASAIAPSQEEDDTIVDS